MTWPYISLLGAYLYYKKAMSNFYKRIQFCSIFLLYFITASSFQPNRDMFLDATTRMFQQKKLHYHKGAIIRGDTAVKELALIFTGDEFGDGGKLISRVLFERKIKASFFLTGNFYRNKAFRSILTTLNRQGNFMGPHSNHHLLYCDWKNRDSLLITKSQFEADLEGNLQAMKDAGIKNHPNFFLPPYEWYNDSISKWTLQAGLRLINFTPGTLSAADYTYPGLPNYRSSDVIFESILKTEQDSPGGLNGYLLLIHIGVDSRRPDKFYNRLDSLVTLLLQKGYQFKRVDEML